MHRLFVALRPPAAIRRHLIDAMGGIAEARWQDDAQLHITLRYIGEVDGAVAEDVATALGQVHAPPLTLTIDGVGSFDQHGGRAAVWAGVTPRDGIAALHRKIDHALIRIGLAPEGRAYRPHVTLARLNRRSGPIEPFVAARAMLASEAFTLDHFLLYESHLGPDGASYAAVARYPLAG